MGSPVDGPRVREVSLQLDDISWLILEILQADARISYRELGARVGLSAPAVTERVRRLERAGVITGYRAQLDFEALGLPLLAIIRITARGGASYRGVGTWAADRPEVIECHRVTGSESHVIRVVCSSTAHLEALIDDLTDAYDVGTLTHIVTSSPVPWSHVSREVVERGTPSPAG